jgi:hypothetical protein
VPAQEVRAELLRQGASLGGGGIGDGLLEKILHLEAQSKNDGLCVGLIDFLCVSVVQMSPDMNNATITEKARSDHGHPLLRAGASASALAACPNSVGGCSR